MCRGVVSRARARETHLRACGRVTSFSTYVCVCVLALDGALTQDIQAGQFAALGNQWVLHSSAGTEIPPPLRCAASGRAFCGKSHTHTLAARVRRQFFFGVWHIILQRKSRINSMVVSSVCAQPTHTHINQKFDRCTRAIISCCLQRNYDEMPMRMMDVRDPGGGLANRCAVDLAALDPAECYSTHTNTHARTHTLKYWHRSLRGKHATNN